MEDVVLQICTQFDTDGSVCPLHKNHKHLTFEPPWIHAMITLSTRDMQAETCKDQDEGFEGACEAADPQMLTLQLTDCSIWEEIIIVAKEEIRSMMSKSLMFQPQIVIEIFLFAQTNASSRFVKHLLGYHRDNRGHGPLKQGGNPH